MPKKFPVWFWCLFTGCLLQACGPGGTSAEEKRIQLAVSANFAATAERLAAGFERQSGCKVELATASSGKLSAQIQNGAPFDLFLSADTSFPAQLHRLGFTEAPRIYAYGRLIAWSTRLPALPAGVQALHLPADARIGIAQPETAPYGRAAEELLRHEGLWDALQGRLVIAESISQLNLYIESGQVDLGLSALSAVTGRPAPGVWTLLPDSLHAPIAQGLAVLRHGRQHHAKWVDAFVEYMESDSARAMMVEQGYVSGFAGRMEK